MTKKIILFFLLFFMAGAVAGCATFNPTGAKTAAAEFKTFETSKGCFAFVDNKKELDTVKIPCSKSKPIFAPAHNAESCWCQNRTLEYFWRTIPTRYLNSKNCCKKNFI